MKRKSQEKAFFDAATNVDEEMIAEASVRRLRAFSRKIICIAAIIVVVALLLSVILNKDHARFVTLPCVLDVYAHEVVDTDHVVTVELKDGQIKQSWPSYSMLTNIVEGLPLTFSILEDTDWTVEISVTDGHFVDSNKDITEDGKFIRRENNGTLGQSFSLSKTRTVYWQPWTNDPETGKYEPLPREVREDIFC